MGFLNVLKPIEMGSAWMNGAPRKEFPSKSGQNLPHFARKWAKQALVENSGMLVAIFFPPRQRKKTLETLILGISKTLKKHKKPANKH